MADTIRDVIIKLRIQQDAAKLQVPDFSGIEQAAKDAAGRVSAAFTAATSGSAGPASGATGGGAGSVAGRATGRSKDAASDVDALREAIRAAEEQLGTLEAAFQSLSDAEKQAVQPMQDAIREAIADRKQELAVLEETERVKTESAAKFKTIAVAEKKAAFDRIKDAKETAAAAKAEAAALRETESASRAAQAQINRLAGDLRSAGEGAFRAARGIALWSASSDDQLQQMIKNVAAVQGLWDIFSGGLNVLRGLTSTFTAVSAAGGVYAVVMTQVARAQAAVTATAGAAAVAIKALWSPVGILVTAVTAAVAVGGYAWNAYAEDVKGAAEAAKPLITQLDHLTRSLNELSQAQARLEHRGAIAGANEFLTTEQRILEVRQRQLATQQQINSVDQAATQRLVVTDNDEQSQAALRVLQETADLHALAVDQQREKIALLKKQKEELQGILEKQQSVADAAKRAADQERDRVRSLQAQVGRLDPVQQAELKRIGERIKDGTATEADYRRLDEGYSGIEPIRNTTDQYYAQRGAPATNDLLAPFNNGVNLTGQGSRLEELVKESERQSAELARTAERVSGRLLQNQTQTTAAINDLLRLMEERFAAASDVEMLRRKFEEGERRRHDRDIGRNGGRNF